MDTDLRNTEQREIPSAHLTLHERLAVSMLIAGVTLWIRVIEVIPDGRR
jgi:hypothetical protein